MAVQTLFVTDTGTVQSTLLGQTVIFPLLTVDGDLHYISGQTLEETTIRVQNTVSLQSTVLVTIFTNSGTTPPQSNVATPISLSDDPNGMDAPIFLPSVFIPQERLRIWRDDQYAYSEAGYLSRKVSLLNGFADPLHLVAFVVADTVGNVDFQLLRVAANGTDATASAFGFGGFSVSPSDSLTAYVQSDATKRFTRNGAIRTAFGMQDAFDLGGFLFGLASGRIAAANGGAL